MIVMKETLYRCDNCGKEFKWGLESWCVLRMFGKGYQGWEHQFHTCGDACCKALQDMPKKQAEKLALQIGQK